MDPTKDPGISIAQIFLEQASFTHREDFLGLPPSTPAQVGDVQVRLQAGVFPAGDLGFMRVEVKTKPENHPIYNFSVAVAALVQPDPGRKPNFPLERYVQIAGLTLLYPFVREAVANLTSRGRFGPVWLKPFNVKAAVESAPKVGEEQRPRSKGAKKRRKSRSTSK